AAILFAPGAVELTPEAAVQLDALRASLTQNQRVQLKAHASGAQDDAGVRRVALKRALAARSHLLAGGLESARIDVRALGPAADGGPDDRLDVIVVAQ
ncbi:MAG: OmpA family protein, partial [Alphaproteobacteria bacterium]